MYIQRFLCTKVLRRILFKFLSINSCAHERRSWNSLQNYFSKADGWMKSSGKIQETRLTGLRTCCTQRKLTTAATFEVRPWAPYSLMEGNGTTCLEASATWHWNFLSIIHACVFFFVQWETLRFIYKVRVQWSPPFWKDILRVRCRQWWLPS
jgi:hypothetical protein